MGAGGGAGVLDGTGLGVPVGGMLVADSVGVDVGAGVVVGVSLGKGDAAFTVGSTVAVNDGTVVGPLVAWESVSEQDESPRIEIQKIVIEKRTRLPTKRRTPINNLIFISTGNASICTDPTISTGDLAKDNDRTQIIEGTNVLCSITTCPIGSRYSSGISYQY